MKEILKFAYFNIRLFLKFRQIYVSYKFEHHRHLISFPIWTSVNVYFLFTHIWSRFLFIIPILHRISSYIFSGFLDKFILLSLYYNLKIFRCHFCEIRRNARGCKIFVCDKRNWDNGGFPQSDAFLRVSQNCNTEIFSNFCRTMITRSAIIWISDFFAVKESREDSYK